MKDTQSTAKKELKPSDEIVQSLMNLRDELYDDENWKHVMIFTKINSCLYSEYPINYEKRKKKS